MALRTQEVGGDPEESVWEVPPIGLNLRDWTDIKHKEGIKHKIGTLESGLHRGSITKAI